jgi:transposase-like protein
MAERGLSLAHTTIMRWVHQYSPELNKRIRKYLKPTNDSYRVDETYIKIKGNWYYLYRAIDSKGNTLDFLLSAKRDKKAAKRFLKKVLRNSHAVKPRVINTDKAPSYISAIKNLKEEKIIEEQTQHRPIKYLNNLIEQDHRFIKWLINPMLGFQSFKTANWIIQGIEAMHMIKKNPDKKLF